MLTAETKRRIDACRNVLVGKLPLPTDQVELITLALIYKFMDDLDEGSVQLGGKRSFFTGSLERYRWRSLLPQTVSADTRLTLFADGIEALGSNEKAAHLPTLFRDIFRNAFLKFRDGRILTLFLNEVNGFAYSHSEELGNAFEYLLQCMGTQGENGQFRTPRHIIDFIVACLDPKPGETILDPACGTGGFLVSAFKHILAKHTSPQSTVPGDKLTHAQRQKVYGSITGYDITDLMVKLSKVNLFLHGFPDPGIHIYDTLSNDARWNEKADLILANPPFMTPKGGVTPHTKFRIPAKKAEVLFTDYIAEHLNSDGRAGVIVPNGIVATTQTAYTKLRRFLIEDSLVAVVSLPSGVFNPYSGVKTSILFLDKSLARQREEILFVKVASDGFDLGAQRRPVTTNDLPAAEHVIRRWLATEQAFDDGSGLLAKLVIKSDILETKDATLVSERFLGVAELSSAQHPMVRLDDPALFRLESGGTPSTTNEAFWNGPHAWATLVDLPAEDLVTEVSKTERTITEAGLRESSAVLLPIGTVVVSTRATLGRVGIARVPLATNQGFKSIIIKDVSRAIPEYVALAVTRLREKMEEFASGGTFKEISKTNFGHLEIPLPPLEDQRRLVAEIEGYQKVLDGARQILAAYTPRFECQADWPRIELSGVVTISSGGTPAKSNESYWSGSIPWISAKDMKQPRLSGAQLHISESAIRETAAELAPIGTVLVLVRGMGLANGVPICEITVPCAFNQDIKALNAKDGLLPGFLAAALRQEATQLQSSITTAAHGTLKLETDRLLSIVIPVPSLDDQARIVAELDVEASQVDSVRNLASRFESKIGAVLDRLWESGVSE